MSQSATRRSAEPWRGVWKRLLRESGQDRNAWRSVRDALGETCRQLAEVLARGEAPTSEAIAPHRAGDPRRA